MKFISSILLHFILCSLAFAASEPNSAKAGKLINDSPLYLSPQYKSDVIQQLGKDEPLSIYQRQRAWYYVLTQDQQNGWVKMLNVRFFGASKRAGELGVKNVFDSVLSRQVSPTASTGIRGFDEADLKAAKADLAQLAVLSSYQLTAEQAKKFAASGQLKVNKSVRVPNDESND